MPTLVLLRHGQSQWNLENRFTGWWDVDLSPAGVEEARAAGQLLRDKGFDFDCCFTSVLTRAIRTLHLALHEMERLWLPVTKDWRLNERHYGGLTGLNKQEMIDQVGAEQVRIWRRSYDIPPPELDPGSPYAVSNDRRYAGVAVPRTESLKDTIARAVPYYEAEIAPALRAGKRVLVAAHGNSLRGIIKYLSDIGDDDIVGLEIPTGKPIVYELRDDLRSSAGTIWPEFLPASEARGEGTMNEDSWWRGSNGGGEYPSTSFAGSPPQPVAGEELLSRRLAPVHFLVGAGHDFLGRVVAGDHRHPDRDAERQRVAVVHEVATRDLVDQPRRGFVRARFVGMGEQDAEFVAADPRHARRSCARPPTSSSATWISAWSPAWWPKLSLIIFSPSRSTKSIAECSS